MSELPGETRPHHVLVQLQRVSGDGRVTTHGPATGRSLPSYTRLCSAPPQGRCPLVLLHCRGTILCSAAAGAPCPSPDQHKSHSCPQGGVLAIHSSHQGLPRKSINDIPRETQDGARAVARMGPSWPPRAGRLAPLPPESRSPCGGWLSVGLGGVCSHGAGHSGCSAARVGGLCSPRPQQRGALSVAATGPGSSAAGRSVLRPQGLAPLLTCCPSPQGLFVLLFHCVLNREVRKHLKGVFVGKKPHPDESATTRATLLTVGGTQGCPRAWRRGCTAHQGPCGFLGQTSVPSPRP